MKIIQGDCLEVLKGMESNSVDCCISSPPYYALRDYGIDGQLGLEKTFHEYLNKLIEIYAEVKRVIKPTGTIWVNLGDSYSNSVGNNGGYSNKSTLQGYTSENTKGRNSNKSTVKINKIIQDKSLLNIPSRFAIRMTDELNLIQRNEIIWYKRNCMPSSVKDRFTVDFEKIYFFTKSKKYYFAQIFEKFESSDKEIARQYSFGTKTTAYATNKNYSGGVGYGTNGRNKRCVWDITTKPYKEAHFATFPEDLVRPMIQAGCPEFICTKCGKAREKIYEKSKYNPEIVEDGVRFVDESRGDKNRKLSGLEYNKFKQDNPDKFLGYTNCNCNAPFTGGIVLDIFAGSGTTLKVAKDMGRDYIGIELNPEYIKLIEKRLELDKLKLAV